MNSVSKTIQLQYQGYLNTPPLWIGSGPMGLAQLQLPSSPNTGLDLIIPKYLRLGKLVERFVIHSLQQDSSIKILLENAQIQNQKITVGELDCVFRQDKQTVHLEIIYKFYLYDPAVGNTHIDHWIGPNRKDSLVKKLNKLKDKQLPLLFNEHTKAALAAINLESNEITQQVCFKAQLFLPYNYKDLDFNGLNRSCVQGFYIPFAQIDLFAACKFYIPAKLDWLVATHTWVDWLSFSEFNSALAPIIEKQTAPLCWLKHPNGNLEKFFVVWW